MNSLPDPAASPWASSIVDASRRAAELSRARGDTLSRFGRTKKSRSAMMPTTARSSRSVKPRWRRLRRMRLSGRERLVARARVDLVDVVRREVLVLALAAGRLVRADRRDEVLVRRHEL